MARSVSCVNFWQLEARIESRGNRFPKRKINMMKRKNRHQKNGRRVDKITIPLLWCVRQNEFFFPGLSFVLQHVTEVNEEH